MNSLQFSVTFSIGHCQLEKFQMTGGSLTYSRYIFLLYLYMDGVV